MTKDITKSNWDDLVHVLPYQEILDTIEAEYGKRERKHLEDYMVGQTVSILPEQAGLYICDLLRFLKYRKQKLSGRAMPLDD